VLAEYLMFAEPMRPSQPPQSASPFAETAPPGQRTAAVAVYFTAALASAALVALIWFKVDPRSVVARMPLPAQRVATLFGAGTADASPTSGEKAAEAKPVDTGASSSAPSRADAMPPHAEAPIAPAYGPPPAAPVGPVAAPAAPVGSTPSAATAAPSAPPHADGDAAPAGAEALTIEIHAVKSVWIEGSADGQRQIYGLLNSGEKQRVQAQHEVSLRVGDASGLEFSINGVPARSLGGPGEIRTIRITPENYKSFLGGTAPADNRIDKPAEHRIEKPVENGTDKPAENPPAENPAER